MPRGRVLGGRRGERVQGDRGLAALELVDGADDDVAEVVAPQGSRELVDLGVVRGHDDVVAGAQRRVGPIRDFFVDYVVVHELCHFHHRDHTDAFWNEVDKVMPTSVSERSGCEGTVRDLTYDEAGVLHEPAPRPPHVDEPARTDGARRPPDEENADGVLA